MLKNKGSVKKMFDPKSFVENFIKNNPASKPDLFVTMSVKNMSKETFKQICPNKVYQDSLNGFLACVKEKGTIKGLRYYNGYDIPADMKQAFEQGKVFVQSIV